MPTVIQAGTSGYSYSAWKGKFFPKGLPSTELLSYYARHFSVVEINSSFYRLPLTSSLKSWALQVPASFRFAFKAPGSITHRPWGDATPDIVQRFLSVTETLGKRLGPLLFQFPPYLKKDKAVVERLAPLLKGRRQVAFEFRHSSWFDPEILALLGDHGFPLVYNDTDVDAMPFVATTSWGYLRLRKTDYTDKELRAYLDQSAKAAWKKAFVFFKHEDQATGPALAARLTTLVVN